MDPLRGTVDVVSAVSLVIRLGQNVRDIKRFLEAASDAQSDLVQLKATIFNIDSISKSMKGLLDQQSEDMNIVNDIYRALGVCQEKLDIMETVVKDFEKRKKGGAIISKGWAHFRLAWKKDRIEEVEKQLDKTMGYLQTLFFLNIRQAEARIESRLGDLQLHQQATIRNLQIENQVLLKNSAMQHAPRYNASPFVGGKKPVPCVVKSWYPGDLLKLDYWKIFRSKMIVLKLSGPIISTQLLGCFRISLQNVISGDAAIIKACRTGNSTQVQRLVDSGMARPNDRTPDNETPLSIAIQGGFEDIVQLLLRKGANPNLPTGRFETSPLQTAVVAQNPSIARILIGRDADPEYNSKRGWSVLHHLFGGNRSTTTNEEFFYILGGLHFDDVKDTEGWTSLHRCAAFGSAKDVKYLHSLGIPADVSQYINRWGENPLHIAASWNNVVTLEALVNLQDPQSTASTPPERTRHLLDSVDFDGWTPLHFAIYQKAEHAMRWLLQRGADPHRKTYSTARWFPSGYDGKCLGMLDLAQVAGEGFHELFSKALMNAGYDISTDGEDIYWSLGPCDMCKEQGNHGFCICKIRS